MSSQKVNMSSQKETTREHSVHTWWMVCLNKGWVVSHTDNWSVNMTVNKNTLYESYHKHCVGESFGRLMFWTRFLRLVKIVGQTHENVDLHSLSECRVRFPGWDAEHRRVFQSRGLPQKGVNSVHAWWNVCLGNGRIVGLEMDGWKDGEVTVSKKDIFAAYRRQLVGRDFGTLMFWKHLKSVLTVGKEDHAMCVLPSLVDCRATHTAWKSERNHGFMPTHVLGN
jgi:hypothetical protein